MKKPTQRTLAKAILGAEIAEAMVDGIQHAFDVGYRHKPADIAISIRQALDTAGLEIRRKRYAPSRSHRPADNECQR